MEMKISEILVKYQDTDKTTVHSYGEVYDEIFKEFGKTRKLNILEIGVWKGASLLAWNEYFKNATVTGVDTEDIRNPDYDFSKINFVLSDVKNYTTDETFDIVIDDGSHKIEDVLWVIDYFIPKLEKGGVLIVEDIQDPQTWISVISKHIPNGYSMQEIDLRNEKDRYDDFLIVIRKNNA